MNILGISSYYHDAAACLVRDGTIVAGAQEERFTRVKHDARFPAHAIAYCLHEAQCTPEDIDFVVFYDKPFLKFERLIDTYLAYAPKGFKSFLTSLRACINDKLFQKRQILTDLGKTLGVKRGWEDRLLFSEHHFSHAASAFFASPFDRAAVITMDGVGEWASTTVGHGAGNELSLKQEIRFPHSLGLLYSAFTSYLGFRVNSGEYKVMGLAPYGRPRYVQTILDNLIDLKEDGSYTLNMAYFDFCHAQRMTNERFHALFGASPRAFDEPLRSQDADIAASIQAVTERVVMAVAAHGAQLTGETNLCLAGGVALNCVANGKLLQSDLFKRIWVQPAAGDAGGAIGAALGVYYHQQRNGRVALASDAMHGGYLGPGFSDSEIANRLDRLGAVYQTFDDQTLLARTAQMLSDGKIIGWFQGRMEFGPRALGARSILANPALAEMKEKINLAIKRRESFRPFAPSVLLDDAPDLFALKGDSQYMQFVATVLKPGLPAITHVDQTARVQTVSSQHNPRFHGLLEQFKTLAGHSCVINTSFNVRGEPIVQSPEDAFACFMNTGLDALVIGNAVLYKHDQTAPTQRIDFAPD